MKKKLLILSSCILSFAAMAQRPQYDLPIRVLTTEEIFAGRYFDLFSVKGSPDPIQKPTVIRQRMIASANRQGGGNNAIQLKDSTRYIYSGTRGVGPVLPAHLVGYNILTPADFDTAFIFLSSDNFTTPQPLYSQQFNSNNGLTHSQKYSTPATAPEQRWITYYPDNKIKKGTSLRGDPSSSNWRYQEVTLDEAGRIVLDSFSNMYPTSNPDRSLNETQYGANGRKEIIRAVLTYPSSGIEHVTRTYFFYNNATSILPYKDSIAKTTTSGSSVTTQISVGMYTYDASDNLVDYTLSQEPGQQFFSKRIYTYNTSGLILTNIMQAYDNATTSWHNNSKIEYAYTQSQMTTYITSVWDIPTNSWKEFNKSIITFNTNGLRDTMKSYTMGTLYSTYTYAYDNHQNLTQNGEYQTGSSGALFSAEIDNYYYEDYEDGTTGIGVHQKNNLEVSIYPNPAGNMLNFKIQSGKQPAEMALSLYDALGRKVYTTALYKNEGSTDVSRLAPGIYYIEINSAKQNLLFRQRFVKQ